MPFQLKDGVDLFDVCVVAYAFFWLAKFVTDSFRIQCYQLAFLILQICLNNSQ